MSNEVYRAGDAGQGTTPKTERPIFGLQKMMQSRGKAIRQNYSGIQETVNQVRNDLPPSSSHEMEEANADVISSAHASGNHSSHPESFDVCDNPLCTAHDTWSIGSCQTITERINTDGTEHAFSEDSQKSAIWEKARREIERGEFGSLMKEMDYDNLTRRGKKSF